MRIETRKMSDLKRPRRAVRGQTDLSDLRSSLKRYGLLQPIVVNAKGEIVAGQRRSQALPSNATVAVVVRDDLDDEVKTLGARLTEELSQEDWNPVELAEAVRQFFELRTTAQPKVPREDLAHELGISISRFEKFLDIAGLPCTIKERVAEQELSPFDALTIDSIKGLEDAEKTKIAEKVAGGKLPGGRRLVTEVAPFIRETVKDEKLRPVREQIVKSPAATFEKSKAYAEQLKEKAAREEAGANFLNTVDHLGLKIKARVRYWRLSTHSARKIAPYFSDRTWEGIAREYRELLEEIQGFLALRRAGRPAQAEIPPKTQRDKVVELVRTLDGTFGPVAAEEE